MKSVNILQSLEEKKSLFSEIAEQFVSLNWESRLSVLDQYDFVRSRYNFNCRSKKHEYLLKQIIVLQQDDKLFLNTNTASADFYELMMHLEYMDTFYEELGGIIGYQLRVIQLLLNQAADEEKDEVSYSSPESIDLSVDSKQVRKNIYNGIKCLDEIAEMYPMGGAADRLQLFNPDDQKPLPAACLELFGISLLERLVQDVQARESLFFKCFGKNVHTPIALMTSLDKNNHDHIVALLEEKNWFGRPKSSFYLFAQPLVPMFDHLGNWIIEDFLKPMLRPGGHGVIWKLAEKKEIFTRLESIGKKKALIRQINNPIAGIDGGLLAFIGYGHSQDKKFGFASCLRTKGVKEGVNVLKTIHSNPPKKVVSNIEYCDLKHLERVDHIEDERQYPANTNLLFVDLKGIRDATHKYPYPGVLLNFKDVNHKNVARLELTMQNLCDYFLDDVSTSTKDMQTFITVNERKKTISSAKKAYTGESFHETPINSCYDILWNNASLFKECGFTLPELCEKDKILDEGFPFLIRYHPALGPLYPVIKQKLRGGVLSHGSELLLNISDIDVDNLFLNGSLRIQTSCIFGHKENNKHHYSNRTGQCILKNFTVKNKGFGSKIPSENWSLDAQPDETCEILLGENSLFIAENVTVLGRQKIVVPDNTIMVFSQKDDKTFIEKRPKTDQAPFYNYLFDKDYHILLEKNYD